MTRWSATRWSAIVTHIRDRFEGTPGCRFQLRNEARSFPRSLPDDQACAFIVMARNHWRRLSQSWISVSTGADHDQNRTETKHPVSDSCPAQSGKIAYLLQWQWAESSDLTRGTRETPVPEDELFPIGMILFINTMALLGATKSVKAMINSYKHSPQFVTHSLK